MTLKNTGMCIPTLGSTFDLWIKHNSMSVLLLTDFTLGSSMGTKQRTLDKALCTPHTKEWQNAYNYEIGQLMKLGTWDLVQLLAGKTLIPHSLVFKEKLGANGNINLWHV